MSDHEIPEDSSEVDYETIAEAPAANCGETAGLPALRPDGLPVGRPFQAGAPSANPLGRPRDPFARFIREETNDGRELVEFALACLRDDLDGRVVVNSGLLEKLETEAFEAQGFEAGARRKGDTAAAELAAAKAKELRSKVKTLRATANRRRKVAVSQKSRITALEWLTDRGWGKARQTVEVSGPNGTPVPLESTPGPLARLSMADLADVSAFVDAKVRALDAPKALPASQAVIRLVPAPEEPVPE